MADSDLLFGKAPITGSPADLVFGEVDAPDSVSVEIGGALPGVAGLVAIVPKYEATIGGTMPSMVGSSIVTYSSNTQRPTVGQVGNDWQVADHANASVGFTHQDSAPTPSYVEAPHQQAMRVGAGFDLLLPKTFVRTERPLTHVRHQDAIRVPALVTRSAWQSMERGARLSRAARHQDGVRVSATRRTSYQDRYRDRRPSFDATHSVASKSRHGHGERFSKGLTRDQSWSGRHQEAWVPRPGITTIPLPPPENPCYVPWPDLVFDERWSHDFNLVFNCEKGGVVPPATVVVPTKRVYIVLNNVTLTRVSGSLDLSPYCLSASLTIDVDSWVWSFSASLDIRAEDDVQPSGSVPVELEVEINGNPYRVIVESVMRDRSFGKASVRVAGRGKAALLSSPYSPTINVVPTETRTAQQLMADVLTDNGVPIGWDIDWQITDWLVPAGAWSHRGTYIDGVTNIATAAGAYVQPHPTNDQLIVLPRYPSGPWDWGTVTPDFELPTAVVTREGIEWKSKPEYNRVFLSGVSDGYLGQITRYGTPGDRIAPMLTDPLFTASEVLSQRGLAVLADTGRQAVVNLRLPVLNETGIIAPGKFVRYVDGGVSRVGIVRSTSVDASLPDVWQTIGVETHE